MAHDLVLCGGTLVDPAQGIHAHRDVAFVGGRVATVGQHLPRAETRQVIDCAGRIVAPGMIDLHVHVFAGAGTFPGLRKYVIDVSATGLLAQSQHLVAGDDQPRGG